MEHFAADGFAIVERVLAERELRSVEDALSRLAQEPGVGPPERAGD